MRYGQLMIGGAGAGKTTYTRGLAQLFTQLKRPFVILNLDAGNSLHSSLVSAEGSIPCLDIRDLVTVEEIALSENLGPNGSLLYCMEQIIADFHWLEDKIKPLSVDTYLIIDCPGQIDLFANSDVIRRLVDLLQRRLQLQLVCVNLVDCIMLRDSWQYISGLLCSLSSMLQLELPHTNVLSKVDLLRSMKDELALGLRAALSAGGEGQGDLRQLLHIQDAKTKKEHLFNKILGNLSELIDDYGMVGFVPLAVEDKELMLRLLEICDKSNGYSGNFGEAMSLDKRGERAEDVVEMVEQKYIEGVLGCGACGILEASLVCGRCKKVKYCDRECQGVDWERGHKEVCRKTEGDAHSAKE
jgi:GTPase SAR1 family protein